MKDFLYMPTLEPGSILAFIRRKDYAFVRALGKGACGETVLVRDDLIDNLYVCKKYAPYHESVREKLFQNFMREIKLLHEVHHRNVVRVFNHFVYPDKLTGYILMEYVSGFDIEEHLKAQPETINELFVQCIDGFAYLESTRILHRDIRPQNLLVRDDGVLKIIDLGFGKQVEGSEDFDKSISLNWWCEPPSEFASGKYTHTTEVYFVGKLFERIIGDNGIEEFKHSSLLERMCRRVPVDRIASFQDAKTELTLRRSEDIEFEEFELEAYRYFAGAISEHIVKIERGAKYGADVDRIRTQLEAVHRSCMLENQLPDCVSLLRVFVAGAYHYRKAGFPTGALADFLRFLRGASIEKQRIALANLHTRLDAIPRYQGKLPAFDDDEIPF